MSEKDKQLIAQARATNYTDWHCIDHLIEQAESPEAKEKLTDIRNYKYHMEEYKSGLL